MLASIKPLTASISVVPAPIGLGAVTVWPPYIKHQAGVLHHWESDCGDVVLSLVRLGATGAVAHWGGPPGGVLSCHLNVGMNNRMWAWATWGC